MKGLLIKDLYVMKSCCRPYLLITAAFMLGAIFVDGNMFFIFYPCLIFGMIPITLLGYDERSGFLKYSAALPYSQTQIVSSKYLFGLIAQTTVLMATSFIQGIKMSVSGRFELSEFAALILSLIITSTLSSSISLPFIFRYGVERGRAAYYVMIGIVCAASVIFAELTNRQFFQGISTNIVFAALAALGIGAYILSWYLSIIFFKKREL